MDAVFRGLVQRACSPASLAEYEAWLHSHVFGADEIEVYVTHVLEAFEALQESPAAQAALLMAVAVSMHKVAPAAQVGDFQMLIMFISELTSSDSPVLLPAVIDLSSAIYCFGIHALVRDSSSDQIGSLFGELESLRKMACAAASVASLGTVVRLHAINAMRDALLVLSNPDRDVTIDLLVDSSVAPASSRLSVMYNLGRGMGFVAVPTTHPVLTPSVIDDVTTDIATALCGLATEPSNATKPSLLLGVISAAEMLLCNRPRLWDVVVPAICALAIQSAASSSYSGASQSTVAAASNSAALRSIAVESALRRFYTLVLCIDSCTKHHSAAKAALEAIGCGAAERPSAIREMQALVVSTREAAESSVDLLGQLTPQDLATLLQRAREAYDGDDVDNADDADGGDDDEKSRLAAEGLVQTSAGPLSPADIAEMIIATLRSEQFADIERIDELHLDGLREMQYAAAREAQWAEIMRARRNEAQGITEIPVGQIAERIRGGLNALADARLRLESPAFRAMFARAAFESVIESYKGIAKESEAHIRQCQGLIARALVQLPDTVTDVAFDTLCDMVATDVQAGFNVNSVHAPFSLAMQVLFTLYSQLAPMHQATAAFGLFGASEQALEFRAAGVQRVLDPDDPLAWMSPGGAAPNSGSVNGLGSKRARDEELGDGRASKSTTWSFAQDSPQVLTSYSAFATRLMAVLRPNSSALKAMLLEAPAITVPMWSFLRTQFCLSEIKEVCQIGFHFLVAIMVKRSVYKFEALTMLLALCIEPSQRRILPHIIAIRQVQQLLAKRTVDRDMVVTFALQQVRKFPHLPRILAEPQSNAATGEAARPEKVAAFIVAYMDFFLAICSIKDHTELLLTLLDVFVSCGQTGAIAVQEHLLRSERLEKFLQGLLNDIESAASVFATIVPKLKSYPAGSQPLVQRLLRVIAQKLRQQRVQRDVADSPAIRLRWAELSATLIGVCNELFESSTLPGAAEVGLPQARDVRFIIPVLSHVRLVDLRKTFIPAILQLTAVESARPAVRAAFLEILTTPSVDASDERMSAVDLLVQLHVIDQIKIEGIKTKMVLVAIKDALELRKPPAVPGGTGDLVYVGPEVLRVLYKLAEMRPVPTLTMRTAIEVARMHRHDQQLVKSICQMLLKKLTEQQVWNSDPQLWKGVVMFIDEHWGQETMQLLYNLPDRIVTQTLREHAGLLEKFKLLPNVGARFAHILTAI